MNETELEELIIQHLAAAAMGRARHISRREALRNRSSAHVLASFWGMMPFRDSLAVALIMSSKGVVELAYFSTFRDIKYEENNRGLVTVNAFTAISPPKLMHEDVCTMALNKQTSFILLPFH
ncbi:hypothetical protein V6N13_077829 [Hibiscus sabdariffa]